MMTPRRHSKPWGFTMIEVLTVLMVTSVVVRIGIPNYQEILLKAEATSAVGDFNVVRLAVMEYQADHHIWPADVGPGQIPPGLEEYLPNGFSFRRPLYRMDWENWEFTNSLPNHPNARGLAALSVVTDNPYLGAALEELLGGSSTHSRMGTTYTFVVEAY